MPLLFDVVELLTRDKVLEITEIELDIPDNDAEIEL